MQSPRIKVDGPAVRSRRMSLGLEIADVATRVGISRSYLSRIEVNSLRLRPRTFQALRDCLDSEADDLTARDEDEQKEVP